MFIELLFSSFYQLGDKILSRRIGLSQGHRFRFQLLKYQAIHDQSYSLAHTNCRVVDWIICTANQHGV